MLRGEDPRAVPRVGCPTAPCTRLRERSTVDGPVATGVVRVEGKAVAVRALVCASLALATVHAQAAGRSCGEPSATSPDATARSSGPALRLTDAHTATRPLTVRYEHSAGATAYHRVDVMPDLVHTLVQVRSQQPRAHLWVRATFRDVATDVDMYLYDARARMVAWSESSNNDVEDQVYDVVFYESDAGGPGWENIDALRVPRCGTFTIETKNSLVAETTPVTVTMWLAPPPQRR